MTLFEFLMMIAAVATAVGITEIVGGWGRMLRSTADFHADWIHIGWSITILIWLIFYWIGMWSYSGLQIRFVAQVMFLIIPTLFGVLAAFAIMPSIPQKRQTFESRAYYLRKRKAIFIPLASFGAMSALADFVVAGPDRVLMNLAQVAALIIPSTIFVFLAFTQRPWVHGAALLVTLLGFLPFLFETTESIATRWTD